MNIEARKQRISKLREKVTGTPAICMERLCLMTESYKQTEGEPAVIRRAKALQKILSGMYINIDDGELIVGKTTSKDRGSTVTPEIRQEWFLQQIESLSTRVWDRFSPLSEDEKKKARKYMPYWEGKSVCDLFYGMAPEEFIRLDHKVITGGLIMHNFNVGHMVFDAQRILNMGLSGIKKEAEAELSKLNPGIYEDFEKSQFLKAAVIALDAVAGLAQRYAELAETMAKNESGSKRRAELKKIAQTCRRVPAGAARTFFEALQSIWFVHIGIVMEGWGTGIGIGRADQYLYPFYKKDMGEGRITKDDVLELFELLYIKMNSSVILLAEDAARIAGGFPIWPNMTLGGVTKDGEDAVNELSYLFLEAEAEVRLQQEEFIIRVNKKTPDAFLHKACEVAKLMRGKFKFVSDDTAIQALLDCGKPLPYARDYIVTGCFNLTVPGVSADLFSGIFNLPMALELALNNGVARLSKERLGLQTGDARRFSSYDDVWNAFTKQVASAVPLVVFYINADKKIFADNYPYPLESALFRDCIKHGKSILHGGTAPYLTCGIGLVGAANVGDSLAAIKKVVFEDRQITMEELVDALDKNFEGCERVLSLLKNAPKFGNDERYVDSIVNDVLMYTTDEIGKYRTYLGRLNTTAGGAVTSNIPLGYIVGALPDGRKAGESLSEGGISPYQGRNVSGPTATMRSVSQLDLARLRNGSVLNMRLDPESLKDEAKISKLVSMIRTFCETGGYLVQFNIVSTETLRDAQVHPEKYRDLLVRVATYSAYFVELSPELQNDIIARTEFQAL